MPLTARSPLVFMSDLWLALGKGTFKLLPKYRYEEGEDVNVENLIPDLPLELQEEVKRHICLNLLKNVSFITSINLLNNCIINFIDNNMKKRIVLLINDRFYDHTSRLKQLAWLVYFILSIIFYESDEILLKY